MTEEEGIVAVGKRYRSAKSRQAVRMEDVLVVSELEHAS